jgi:hypothetical protein
MNPDDARQEARTLYEAWWKLIPDARVSPTRRRTVWGPLGEMTDCFCVNCGRPYGLVTVAVVEHVFVLCNACFEKHGHLPMQEVPPEVAAAISHLPPGGG